jgi:hypothetical protein
VAGAAFGGIESVLYIACWFVDGYRRVPYVNANSDGDFKFDLGNFENTWNPDNCLLCFCNLFVSPAIICWWEFCLRGFSSNPQAYARLHQEGG